MKHAETRSSLAFRENPGEFFANPLGADAPDCSRHFADSGPRSRLDGVAEARPETNGAEQPQFVFLETFLRVPDSPDNAIANVLLAGNVIGDPLIKRIVEKPGHLEG